MTEESEEDTVRADLVVQLRESLARSREMMLNEKLDSKTREKWTQVHTNTAQVLNLVLRDRQFKDWERRLREMEARRRKLTVSIQRLEEAHNTSGQTSSADPTAQDPSHAQGGS